MDNIYKAFFKRFLDVAFSITGLLVLFPVIMVIAILIKIFIGPPIIFQQLRPGYQGGIFTIYKFRTMKDLYDANGNLLPDRERLTVFGGFLRQFSLDELPELFNVIKGDMSLVGPRPLLAEYLKLYNANQRRRHDVKPGITGLAQVSGRNSLSWDEKFGLDIEYVDHVSFSFDIKILLITLIKVFSCVGINQSNQVTMEKFQGEL